MNRSLSDREHAKSIMCGFDTAMLVSKSEKNQLRARPMAIAKHLEGGDVWFVTNRDSSKVDEILDSPEIAVTCQSNNQFVSLSGRAKMVEDRVLIDKLWSEAWKVWFPEGKEDPRIVLICFTPEEVEFWDNAGANGLRYLFKAGVAYLQGETPAIDHGIHAKLKT